MRTLLLNSTYEPMQFLTFRKAVNLLINGKVERISAWDDGLKHSHGYDFVCGANLLFYNNTYSAFFKDKKYSFCSKYCSELFELDPLQFLMPAIVKLKEYIPRHIKKKRYNRTGVFKRDKYQCQYCGYTFKALELTIDHVVPRSVGGITSWENCVTCCYPCNNFKSDRTPKMAGMKLIKKPNIPLLTIWHEYITITQKHDDWEHYIIKYSQ